MVVKVLPGVNDLATTHPHLLEEWSLDNIREPTTLVAGSTYRATWVCSYGHMWETQVRRRGLGKHGCPFCAGQAPISGVNDLATLHPALAKEWSNRNVKGPDAFLPGSGKKAWWECNHGHEWEAVIETRTKRGYGCPTCSGRIIQYATSVANNSTLMKEWSSKNTADPSKIGVGNSRQGYYWECEKGHVWKTAPRNRKQGKGCPHCIDWATSRAEKELQEYLQDILPSKVSLISHSRKQIHPFELDFYIPSLAIGIEFNGLYWHSSLHKPNKNYHVEKLERCAAVGIRLIQVWEDDWCDHRKLIERMLARELGVSSENHVNACESEIVSVQKTIAQQFLGLNHVQGPKNCSFYCGLRYKNELVAVLGITKYATHWVAERYASNTIVEGGFRELVTYTQSLTDLPLIAYANREISDVTQYEEAGMRVDRILPPDYSYLYKHKRRNKFSKARFRNDPKLQFDPSLTECELADLNRIPRIYNSGKIRYILGAYDSGPANIHPSNVVALEGRTFEEE